MGTKENRLLREKSPYLKQHGHNPVDWFPWGDEAFRVARERDLPIFLSIGYYTCHWCHVMERECFEDPEVAELLNRHFVSIKVDREERPDIDQYYMTFCQMTTGSGGWPLSVFLTPDKRPFLAFTYIPKHSSPNRLGMMDLLPAIAKAWKEQKEELIVGAGQAFETTKRLHAMNYPGTLDETLLRNGLASLRLKYDMEYGGFGKQPKFPMPHQIMFLLRYHYRYQNQIALEMASFTLERMRMGGIYDQLGFGFHRYSTDRQWLLPHFEKMLYDQALLLMAYVEAYQQTRVTLFKDTAQEIIQYVLRNLRSPMGGFFSGEDADSGGREGGYYLWTVGQLREILSGEDLEVALEVYGVSEEGNYLEEGQGSRTGQNVLHLKSPLEDIARKLAMRSEELKTRLERIRERLFEARLKRPGCNLDYKILTDWNGLMVAALAKAAAALGEPGYLEVAETAHEFLSRELRKGDYALLHSFIKGDKTAEGLLDDYAFYLMALLELYDATLRASYIDEAEGIAERAMELFWDNEKDGFFTCGQEPRDLPTRPRLLYDGSYPSGGSVISTGLLRLYELTGNNRFRERARQGLYSIGGLLREQPSSYSSWLISLDFYLGPVWTVGLGFREGRSFEIISGIRKNFLPRCILKYEGLGNVTDFEGHICKESTCGEPFTKKEDLIRELLSL